MIIHYKFICLHASIPKIYLLRFYDNYDHFFWCSYGWGTWNNFAKLHGDFGLSGFVVLESKFVHDFSCVLWSVLHGVHSRSLFRRNIVQISMIEHGVNVEFVEEVSSVIKIGLFSIMLDNVSETFQKFVFIQNFSLFENLTDDVFEFTV